MASPSCLKFANGNNHMKRVARPLRKRPRIVILRNRINHKGTALLSARYDARAKRLEKGMMPKPFSTWTTAEKSGLVSIGTHKLYLSTSGPIRTPGDPLLIVFPGANTACESWKPVSSLLQDTVSVLLYDRSGLGCSERGPEKRDTGSLAAEELSMLLGAVDLPGPYVLVAHSYGGCVAREFLQLHNEDVVGMVLSETGTETECRYAEDQYRRQVLGDCPLSVIRGESAFSARREEKEEDVSVPDEQRRVRDGMLEAMGIADEQLKREQLKLSRNSRFRNVPGCGHNVHLTHPDVVVEEIKWVLSHPITVSTQRSVVGFADSKFVVWVRQILGLS